MTTVNAYAAHEEGGEFKEFEYELGDIHPDEVEIQIAHCGICHSDLSMLDNSWGMTDYPFVGGHEVVGKVAAVGDRVPNVKVGDTVGVGWYSASCMHCPQCLGGQHNLCPSSQGIIVKRHGGFADRVRCHWGWTIPLPEQLDLRKAGPLFCGGITVFSPLVEFGVKPTNRVGVIGIGGLGHLAIKFLRAWGCEVTAFSTSPDKEVEVKNMGAHHFVNSQNAENLKKLAGSFDFILNTTNVSLDWDAYVAALRPKGRLSSVGAIPDFGVKVFFPLLAGQKTLSASPFGTPTTLMDMLDFCVRHQIHPQTEHYSLANINDAFECLRQGKARYRLVLDMET